MRFEIHCSNSTVDSHHQEQSFLREQNSIFFEKKSARNGEKISEQFCTQQLSNCENIPMFKSLGLNIIESYENIPQGFRKQIKAILEECLLSKSIKKFLSKPCHFILIALKGNEVAGVIFGKENGLQCKMSRLAVNRKWRSNKFSSSKEKIGFFMTRALVHLAQKKGLNTLTFEFKRGVLISRDEIAADENDERRMAVYPHFAEKLSVGYTYEDRARINGVVMRTMTYHIQTDVARAKIETVAFLPIIKAVAIAQERQTKE